VNLLHETKKDGDALVSLADLAEMAGVSRPAVSNWRSRNDDFPIPVQETGATSLFRLSELQTWMRKHGKRLRAPTADQLMWSALNRIRGQVRPEEAAEAGMVLLGYMALAARLDDLRETTLRAAVESDVSALNSYVRHLGNEAQRMGFGDTFIPDRELPWWWDQSRSFLTETIELALKFGVAEVFEALISAAARGSRGAGEHATPQSVAELIVTLAAPKGGTVFDPACGHGTLLLAASQNATAPLTLTGQEINSHACRIARLRMFVHGLNADIAEGDTLMGGGTVQAAKYDLVLADPPFGASWRPEESMLRLRFPFGIPPRSRAEMAWLQSGIQQLNPGGQAIYVFPAGPLFRSGVERDIRCRLIQANAVQAIVVLPPMLYPSTGIAVALWIVGRPDERNDDRVLLVDASHLGSRGRARTELSSDDIAAIEGCFRGWQTESEVTVTSRVQATAVSAEELLASDGVLNPARWIEDTVQDPRQRIERITAALGTIEAAKNAFGESLPFEPHFEPAYAEISTDQRMFRLDAVAKVIRPRRIDPEAVGTGAAPLIVPRDLSPDLTVLPSDTVDIDALGNVVEISRPGDIIVMADGAKPRAAVDHIGGAVVGAPLQIVQVQREFMDPIVLAALITLYAPRYAVGSTIKHVDLAAMELPYPNPEIANWLRQALDSLGEQRRQAITVVKVIDELRTDLVDGLCSHTIQLSPEMQEREGP
jgi:predicted DNA-binding transcriptional regulator AlpA